MGKKWSFKVVTALKIIHIFIFYIILSIIIATKLKPFMRTISQGEFSAVQWMVNPIIVLTILVYWRRMKLFTIGFCVFWIKKVSLFLYEEEGILIAGAFNFIVLELFMLLTVFNNFLLVFGWHLCLCNLWFGVIFIVIGVLLNILLISYFRTVNGDFIFLQTSDFEEIRQRGEQRESQYKSKETGREKSIIERILNSISYLIGMLGNGMKRLLIVMWFLAIIIFSLAVDERNAGVAFLLSAILYPLFILVILWIYEGFVGNK